MVKKNMFYSDLPTEVSKGGTGNDSFTSYAVLTGGPINTDDPLLDVGSLGISGDVLTSEDVWELPQWKALPTFFEPLASDPSSPTPGDTWYNTTEKEFKGAISGAGICSLAGSWTIKANLSAARTTKPGAGIVTDALCCCGNNGSTQLTSSERYDGGLDTWTSKANNNTSRASNGCCGANGGAVLIMGGTGAEGTSAPIFSTESYDGSLDSWTAKANLNTAVNFTAASGTNTDALCMTSKISYTVPSGVTQRYDSGTNTWTTKSSLSSNGYSGGSSAQSAGDCLFFGGQIGGNTGTSFLYDGAGDTWTSKALMNQEINLQGSAGDSGTAFSCGGSLFIGAYLTPTNYCDRYSGSTNTWSAKSTLNVARTGLGSAGIGCGALTFGGVTFVVPTTFYTTTELYDGGSGTHSIITFDTI